MNRLIAFGCSFTKWYHPTPADWLSSCFQGYNNLGIPGSGNDVILNFVNKTWSDDKKNNVLLIQWSGLLRSQKRKPSGDITKFLDSEEYPWQTGNFGHVYDKVENYYYNVYNLFSTFKLNKVRFITTHMLSPWADDRLGEPLGFVVDPISKKIYYEHLTKLKEHKVFYKILDLFQSSPHAVEGMMDYYLKNNIYKGDDINQFNGIDSVRGDHHPDPEITLKYAREILAPKLKELYEINTDNLFDKKLDGYAASWMHFLKHEDKKILDNGLWLNNGNYVPHSFKPYVPWYVKNNIIFEYKLPLY